MALKILYVSVEVAPFAKVGGLADVAGSLPKALQTAGHDVRVYCPAYGCALGSAALGAKRVGTATIQMNPNWAEELRIFRGVNEGVPTILVGNADHFEWVHVSEDIYKHDRDSYLLFCKSVMAVCEELDWIPDVVHCNDWQAAFVPVFLRELGGNVWGHTSTVYSIHNLAYQGVFGPDTLDLAGLDESLFTSDKLEFFGNVNFLKSACKYADMVNTVSPNYANEIQTERYGCGLWGVMRDLQGLGKLRGILNGIDQETFDPTSDPEIAALYSVSDLSGKSTCKKAIQAELGLPVDPEIPMMSVISRLSDQKGFDLVARAAYGMLDLPMQFVVLAVGDQWAAGELRKLEHEWPANLRFIERFDAPLAQRIYAGSDLFLMASHFEPCGLGQLIAMRYGTVPVARNTGGLTNTVFDGVNGFMFEEANAKEMFDGIKRGVRAFEAGGAEWEKLILAGMRHDSSWTERAAEYVSMYDAACESRKVACVCQ
ncbi:MAG: glycogen synthase [Armatimonadetes bacterium]|nr:glycogen synthase [Armatimonadota bacterium]